MAQITIDESQLEALIAKNELYEKDIADLIYVAEGIIKFLGLVDENGKIKKEYLTGEEKPMPAIIKAGSHTLSLMMQAQVPILGRKADAELSEKFKFIDKLLPLLKKYS